MRRALSEFALGARLALTGGADSRLRTALTASGVSLGVALLLFASSVPNMIHAHDRRVAATTPAPALHHGRLLGLNDTTDFHGTTVAVNALQATGPNPPLPPGISRIPRPNEMFVSPALESLLRSPRGAQLARRLHARVIGTIDQAGLIGPTDLLAYRGASGLSQRSGSFTIGAFGGSSHSGGGGGVITILVILMVVALLLPIGVFVATAGRFGSEQRNQRLAALRLLGADRGATARVAAGESLVGAVAGVIVGAVLFVAVLRPLVPHVDIAGISVFSTDVRPSALLAALAIVLVPAAAVVFALLAMRNVSIEPLGVTRQARPPRRRLAWRLLTPLLGFLLLAPLVNSRRVSSTGGEIEASAGVILVLVGVCALLPWLVETIVERVTGGSVPWLLAVRRLRADPGTSGRVVGAIGLAVAGAIALQTVFSGANAQSQQLLDTNPVQNMLQVNALVNSPNAAAVIQRRLRALHGVTAALATASPITATDQITVATCPVLTSLIKAGACTSDSAFIVGTGTGLRPGQRLKLGGQMIVVPADARTVATPEPSQLTPLGSWLQASGLVLTPGTASKIGVRAHNVYAVLRINRRVADVSDHVADAIAQIDPLAQVSAITGDFGRDATLDHLRRALIAGAVAVLLVIGGSLLVAAAEQLRERRHALAVLAAFGMRRSTLVWSVFWQTALPVAIGLALAIGLGVTLGAILMAIVDLPLGFDWGAIALLTGAGALVVAAVTGLTMPLLWRQTRPDGLHAE